jgi:hypothetical protein
MSALQTEKRSIPVIRADKIIRFVADEKLSAFDFDKRRLGEKLDGQQTGKRKDEQKIFNVHRLFLKLFFEMDFFYSITSAFLLKAGHSFPLGNPVWHCPCVLKLLTIF